MRLSGHTLVLEEGRLIWHFPFHFPADRYRTPDRLSMQCSSQVVECRAFSAGAYPLQIMIGLVQQNKIATRLVRSFSYRSPSEKQIEASRILL